MENPKCNCEKLEIPVGDRQYCDNRSLLKTCDGVNVKGGNTETPRRANMWQWSAAEKAIYDAMQEIEKLPPSVGLTDAVILLKEAQEKVADFIDSNIKKDVQK